MRLVRALTLSACLLLGLTSITLAAPMFMGLGDLPGGESESIATAVSADGSVVVGYGTPGTERLEAFRWTASGGMVGLGFIETEDFPPSSWFSYALGVSANGNVVVGSATAGRSPVSGNQVAEAWRWTEETGIVQLRIPPENPTAEFQSDAKDVSSDGSVVVGRNSVCGDCNEAFRWTEETGMVNLGDLPGGAFQSNASGVSADGSVVVGSSNVGVLPGRWVDEAFRWTEGTGMVGLGFIPGFETSWAISVSADGSVIAGGASDPAMGSVAIRWTEEEGMLSLGSLSPADDHVEAWEISADGSAIVGASGTVSLGHHAFIWDATNGMRPIQEVLESEFGLDLTGWNLEVASGISNDGRTVVGYGTNELGFREGWIAVIPEPSTALLLACGLTGLAAAAWRRATC